MKKILFKTSVIAFLTLSTSLGWSEQPSSCTSISSIEEEDLHLIPNRHFFTHLFAMGTSENLKTYHIGLRSLFPNYQAPCNQDLLTSIRSHQKFVGYLSREEALDRFKAGEFRYFIFEEKDHSDHFYVAYSGNLRHFTVNHKQYAGIDNGVSIYYPSLSHFLNAILVV